MGITKRHVLVGIYIYNINIIPSNVSQLFTLSLRQTRVGFVGAFQCSLDQGLDVLVTNWL